MSEFITRVIAELDLSKAESKMNSFMNKKHNIDIDVNIKGMDKFDGGAFAQQAAKAGEKAGRNFSNSMSKQVKNAQKGINNFKFQADFSKMNTQLKKFSGQSSNDLSRATKALVEYRNAYKNLRSLKNGDGTFNMEDAKVISSFEKMTTASEKFKNSMAMVKNSTNTTTSNIAKDFDKAQNLAKKLSKTKIEIAGLDPNKKSNEISALNAQVKQIGAEYKLLMDSMGKNFNKTQKGDLRSIFGNMRKEIDLITAKSKDMNAALTESQNAKSLAKDFEKAHSLAKQISSTKIKIEGLDSDKNSNEKSILSTQLENIKTEYDKLKQGLNNEQNKILDSIIGNADTKIDQIKAKAKDMNAALADSQNSKAQLEGFKEVLALKKQIGATEIDIQKLDKNKSQNEHSFLTNQLSNMNAEYDLLMKKFGNGFSVDQKGQLDTVTNNTKKKIDEIIAKTKDLQVALKDSQAVDVLDNQIASNKTLKWLKNNTKAAKDYGQALTDLANKQQNAQTVGEAKNLQKQVDSIISTATLEGKTGNSWTTEFRRAFSQIGQFVGIYGVIQKGIQTAKQMATEVINIDTAMTNLKKVTDETDASYSNFLSNSGKTARSLGADVSSYITQTSEWAKLGFNMKSSGDLAKTSMTYSNVGEVDDKTAVGDLVTAMKAFNIEANSSIQIVDSLNALSNKYAVSAAGLGEGLKNSASALSMQGNSLEQVLAMLTGGGEITQSPGELGNALKVVSFRLASMKGKLSEIGEEYENINSVSKNQTEIYNMTKGQVNILDEQNGKLKNTYTILEEVAGAWDSINNLERSELAELMFGKNRANEGLAVIQGFQSGQVQKALADALNSEGSAQAEQDKWMNSLEAKINSFKAAFQELSSATLNSDFLKGAVDGATALLEVLTQIISVGGGIPAILAGIGGFKLFKNLDWPKTWLQPYFIFLLLSGSIITEQAA